MSNGPRIGVYVDGYNLYYGAKRHLGRSTQSWKWIDVRGLVERVLSGQVAYAQQNGYAGMSTAWQNGSLSRVVYCTARIDSAQNPDGYAEQGVYLKALRASQSVDWIEHGHYVTRTKSAPLAVKTAGTGQPQIVTSQWPIMVQDSSRQAVPNAQFIVSYLHTEEKGSDVNVASHLLSDVLGGNVDAAIVVSNDSDLRLPVEIARGRVPVGVVCPSGGHVPGALRHNEPVSTTSHWNRSIRADDILACQLPGAVGTLTRPSTW